MEVNINPENIDGRMVDREGGCKAVENEIAARKDTSPTKATDDSLTEKQILKNVILMSGSFLVLFTSYSGLAALQSSLHIQEGMGVITQGSLYAVMSASCLFIPKFAVQIAGHKWSFIASMVGYIIWMAANGYAVWGTMLPASMLVGLCAAPLWTSQCAYFTIVAQKYAEYRNEAVDAVTTRFFGIFFAVFRLNGLASAVIQTTILRQHTPENETKLTDEEIGTCGLNDCPWNNVTSTNFNKPPSHIIWTLVGVYIGLAILGLILSSIFIDNIPESWIPESDKQGSAKEKTKKSLVATVFHLRHFNQWLLIPLTIYSGLEQTFYTTEYYKSYITCLLGMWIISLVRLPSAVVNAITSFTGGRLVQYTGMLPLFIIAFVVDLGMQISLYLWRPHPDHVAAIFIIPALQGVTDAFYSVLFPEDIEAAFSNYRLWECIGYVMAFAWSSFLCTSAKLYINTSFLLVGMSLFLVAHSRSKFCKPLGKEKVVSTKL